MAIYFPAVIETDAKGGYGVFFPDLPGCVSAGDTQDEAVQNAAEALLLHLEGMVEDRMEMPEPSRLESLPSDPDVHEAGRVLVRAGPFRPERVNVSFDGLTLARIDAAAEKAGKSRSEFLADAARRLLDADPALTRVRRRVVSPKKGGARKALVKRTA